MSEIVKSPQVVTPPASIHIMTEMNVPENSLTPEQILENHITTIEQNFSESYDSFSRS
jgi:hypothetical protein